MGWKEELAAIRAAKHQEYLAKSNKNEEEEDARASKTEAKMNSSSSSSTGRKKAVPMRNKGNKRKLEDENEDDDEEEAFEVESDNEEEDMADSFLAKSLKRARKKRLSNYDVYIKTLDDLALDYLHNVKTGGLVEGMDADALRDFRLEAWGGGPVPKDLEKAFMEGDLKACRGKGKYILHPEEDDVLVAYFYRTVGNKKLLNEPVQILSVEDLTTVMEKIRQRMKRHAISHHSMATRSATLFWNAVFHDWK